MVARDTESTQRGRVVRLCMCLRGQKMGTGWMEKCHGRQRFPVRWATLRFCLHTGRDRNTLAESKGSNTGDALCSSVCRGINTDS